MRYTLMHKYIPVVDMEIDDATHTIVKIRAAHDIRHLPPGIGICQSKINLGDLYKWYMARIIPLNRQGLWGPFESLGVVSPHFLVEKCYGLSLSDQYWICPKGSDLKWNEINFFQNDFSKDMGELLFGHEIHKSANINLMSPDITTNGRLRKKWVSLEGKFFLIKDGSDVFKQEPFNEVVACAIMRRLGIPHVDYALKFDGGEIYSLCENFVTRRHRAYSCVVYIENTQTGKRL